MGTLRAERSESKSTVRRKQKTKTKNISIKIKKKRKSFEAMKYRSVMITVCYVYYEQHMKHEFIIYVASVRRVYA